MKRQKTKLNPVRLAFISIAGKWFAEKQLAIPTLLVSISLGKFFMGLISSQSPFPEIINQKLVVFRFNSQKKITVYTSALNP